MQLDLTKISNGMTAWKIQTYRKKPMETACNIYHLQNGDIMILKLALTPSKTFE